MRIVLTIDDKKYNWIPPGKIRDYIREVLLHPWDENRTFEYFTAGLEVEINILDDNVDVKTGEIISEAELLALEKKIQKLGEN